MAVSFITSCWELDWEILLKTKLLQNKIERNVFNFFKKILIINNVKNKNQVQEFAKKVVDRGVITDYFFVDDFAEEVLSFFNLSKKLLGRSYYYSIHELVGIYLCYTPYLLFFTGDSWLKQPTSWIAESIKELEKDSSFKVANPLWNGRYAEAKKESYLETSNFFVGQGFSDQCFLVKTSDLKQANYNETHHDSVRFPKYAGHSFESRFDSWMRNHGYYRLTFKHASYIHRNFPKNSLMRTLFLQSGAFNRY